MRARQSDAPRRRGVPRRRRGTVLILVLIVVMLMSLGAYSFSELMISERAAVAAAGRGAQARAGAQSGVEYAAALLGDRANLTDQNLYHDAALFRAQPVTAGTGAETLGWFSLVAPVETDPSAQQIRFGLMDESGKINLNVLAARSSAPEDDAAGGGSAAGPAGDGGRTSLMYLPGMTEEIADSILDFVDADQTPREFGAEGEFYSTLDPPYVPKDAPLESIEELLLVRDVTPWLLFGEDANRNGLLDPSENDGEASLPLDDGDGALDLGWSAYLSVHSREANARADGTPRINLNQSMLTELYDALEPELGADAADFIVAYLTNGPVKQQGADGGEGGDPGAGGSPSGGGRSNGTGSGSSPQSNGAGSGGEEQALQQLAQGVAKAVGNGGGGAVTRGGIDLSKGATVPIQSIYDLVDAEVEVEVDGVKTKLGSPWTSENLDSDLPLLTDILSTTDAQFIAGRVNINQARLETLLGIPGMPEELAYQIAGSQMIGSNGEPLADTIEGRSTTGWLVTQGLTDVATMRKLDRYITAGGDVYRAHVIGHLDVGGPVSRLEAVIDATQIPARVVALRDLTDLGRGVPRSQLQVAQ